MRVKIGNKIYDSKIEPIMIIFEEYNKEDIRNMDDESTKYCEYPDGISTDEIAKFMHEEGCINFIEDE
jgi:hypothetical protein